MSTMHCLFQNKVDGKGVALAVMKSTGTAPTFNQQYSFKIFVGNFCISTGGELASDNGFCHTLKIEGPFASNKLPLASSCGILLLDTPNVARQSSKTNWAHA